MPRRTDIEKILIIGSGPIVIGQACEFDYSGTQAVKALKEEGYEVILVNSNPATIMTDPELADRVYIEPISLPYLTEIIRQERPQAILPTVGGQTALNAALSLDRAGVLREFSVELIGAKVPAIEKAENRKLFKEAMEKIGARCAASGLAHNMTEAYEVLERVGFPVILRPSFTLGGTGGGVCYNREEFERMVANALSASPNSQVLIEQSILGWKEFEMEVMRDLADNVVIICSLENLDPMGVHTGDSITVAPQQTLSDREYQELRDLSIAIIREIGVETGGSNIQFAINPADGEIIVVEMNPRVSRSSALASKATGFPIAKIAAKLSVGYTLDEITNDITEKTPASFEPSIDYIVTKIPRFTFEKFPESPRTLDTQMRSVGEAMAIGRTFPESFQKAMRSLETGRAGWGADGHLDIPLETERHRQSGDLIDFLRASIAKPTDLRIYYLREAMAEGMSHEDIYRLTGIDPWFLAQLKRLLDFEAGLIRQIEAGEQISADTYAAARRLGYSLRQLACICEAHAFRDTLTKLARLTRGSQEFQKLAADFESKLEGRYLELFGKFIGSAYSYKRVDTCAAEFESHTPYLYSTFEREDESEVSDREKVIILGGGPNRIGQGIEFDYCCCHASFALQDLGLESIMVNSNPETVSTDYDTSDRLYFEPLTEEDILRICHTESRKGKFRGVILQFGGQTPLRLAKSLLRNNIPVLGTSPADIHRAEDRKEFNELITELGLRQPEGGLAFSTEEATTIANRLGYPVLARPSYVLGGRAMSIVHNDAALLQYMKESTELSADRPLLIDKFLDHALELDVDALCDGEDVYIAGILEHIEEAGVHSGDSACEFPPVSVPPEMLESIKSATATLARKLNVIGCINVQYAIFDGELYVIEVNPRASRTVPFISKALGIPVAGIATKLIMGANLKDFHLPRMEDLDLHYVKEVVLPFKKFSGVDTILGPEMKSTGEVMGIGRSSAEAFYKAQEASGATLPLSGSIFVSVSDPAKARLSEPMMSLSKLGFRIVATSGTADFLEAHDIPVVRINKVHEGRPHIVDSIKSGEIDIIVNLPTDVLTRNDALEIRLSALRYNIPYFTTMEALVRAVEGISKMKEASIGVYPITRYPA